VLSHPAAVRPGRRSLTTVAWAPRWVTGSHRGSPCAAAARRAGHVVGFTRTPATTRHSRHASGTSLLFRGLRTAMVFRSRGPAHRRADPRSPPTRVAQPHPCRAVPGLAAQPQRTLRQSAHATQGRQPLRAPGDRPRERAAPHRPHRRPHTHSPRTRSQVATRTVRVGARDCPAHRRRTRSRGGAMIKVAHLGDLEGRFLSSGNCKW
jgi:hypothetical protein